EAGVALVNGDPVGAHQVFDAFAQPVGGPPAVLVGAGVVGPHVVHFDAKGRGPPDLIQQARAVEQRLGGDAAPVEADAAQGVFFDESHAQTQLAGADGAYVAPRTAADDNHVVAGTLAVAHKVHPLRAKVCRSAQAMACADRA